MGLRDEGTPLVRLGSMKVCACAALLALGALLTVSPAHAQSGPFAGMAGSWSGVGLITPTDGPSERVRCKVRYAVSGGGATLQQDIRCASDSYDVAVTGEVRVSDGSVSGTWNETNRKVSGSLSGDARSGLISARVDGPGFTAALTIETRNQIQTISIKPQGTDINRVAVTLTRE